MIDGTKAVAPTTMVIFGAAGDLTKRKLIPALYNLLSEHLIPQEFAVLGVARAPFTTDSFRAQLRQEFKEFMTAELDPGLWDALESRLHYLQGNFDDPAVFASLGEKLKELDQEHKVESNRLFYLATSPEYFAPIVKQLAAKSLVQESEERRCRVIVEKPFGRDLESAVALNQELRQALKERQIYRIDHYLGKETVQNILVFRFSNGVFEPIWNHRYVDHVQITVAETIGVEGRGNYYESAGALRDMVPNHVFQLISLVAMEPPISFDADAVRDEQTKALRAIQPFTAEDVLSRTVRGQYGPGTVDGKAVPAYREEKNVDPKSNTETFVAMKLSLDNWRWTGVPFFLRVGKALARRQTEITIQFKRPPFVLFRNTNVDRLKANQLVIRIQPDEGISLRFGAKVPGAVLRLGVVEMEFNYAENFGSRPATGYERLLYDAMLGDQTLFQRADQVEAAWSVVTPILDVWKALPARQFPNYAAGSWGPKESDQLLEGRTWRNGAE